MGRMGKSRQQLQRIIKGGVATMGIAVGAALLLGPGTSQAATLTVQNTLGGVGDVDSLAFHVAAANNGDVIVFAGGVTGTITLDATLLVDRAITITGPGSSVLAITTAAGTVVEATDFGVTPQTFSISGLEIKDGTGAGLTYNGAGDALIVDDVDFTDNASGIEVVNQSASVSVTNSTFSGHSGRAIDIGGSFVPVPDIDISGVVVDNGGAVSATGDGIRLESITDVDITNTTVSGQSGEGVEVTGGGNGVAPETVTLTNVSATGSNEGVEITGVNGPIVINGNSDFSNNTTWGLRVVGVPDVGGADITALTLGPATASMNVGEGFRLQQLGALDVDDVEGSDNAFGFTLSGSDGPIDIDTSTFNDNTSDGVNFSANPGTTTITSVTANDNGASGIEIRNFSLSPIVTVTGNVTDGDTIVSGNGGTGVEVTGAAATEVSNVTATGNALGVTTAFTGALSASDLQISGSVSTAMIVTEATGTVSVSDSTIDNNLASGLSVSPGSPVVTTDVTIDNVSADGNAGTGLSLGGSGLVTVRNGSSASANSGGPGIDFGGPGRLVLADSTFDDNSGDGVDAAATLSGVGGVAFTSTSSSFDGNGGEGVQIGSIGTDFPIGGSVSITGGTIDGNTGNGVDVDEIPMVTLDGVSIDENVVGVRASKLGGLVVDNTTMSANDEAIFANEPGAFSMADSGIDNGAPVPASDLGVSILNAASVDIDDTTIRDFDSVGLSIDGVTGAVGIDGSTVIGHTSHGATVEDVTGATTIGTTNFNDNTRTGLIVLDAGAVAVNGSSTLRNGETGVNAGTLASLSLTGHTATDTIDGPGLQVGDVTGNLSVTGGAFSSNQTLDVGKQGIVANNVTGTTTLSGVTATSNTGDGVGIGNSGPVRIIGGSVVSSNAQRGVDLADVGAVTVTGSTVDDNGDDGLSAFTAGAIAISGSTFDDNGNFAGEYGVELEDVTGNVAVTTSQLTSNEFGGLAVRDASGTITLDGSTFEMNRQEGARLGSNTTSVGAVSATGATFEDNATSGLRVENAPSVMLTNTSLAGNYRADGIGGADAPPSIGAGLDAVDAGDLTLDNATVTNNGGTGVLVRDGALAGSGTGAVTITKGAFSDNVDEGIFVLGSGAVMITDATFDGNTDGASFFFPTTVDVAGATFEANSAEGLSISEPSGAIGIADSTFDDHPGRAALGIDEHQAVDITGSVFTGNDSAIRTIDSAGPIQLDDVELRSNRFGLLGVDPKDVSFTDVTAIGTSSVMSLSDVVGDVSVMSSSFDQFSGEAIDVVGATGDVRIVDTSITDGRRSVRLDTIAGSALIDRSSISGSGGDDSIVDAPLGVIDATDVAGGLEIITSSIFDHESSFAVDAVGTDLALRHSTITDVDFFAVVQSDSDVDADHSIVAGTFDPADLDPPNSFELVTPVGGTAPTLTATRSFLTPDTAAPGPNVFGDDAQLAAPALNGGTTLSLAPLTGSAMIDAGDPNVSAAPATDQRNGARVLAVIDIGSVEFDATRDVPPTDPDEPDEPLPASLIESLTPARFADTRPTGETVDRDFEADGRLVPTGEYRVQIGGRGLVPADAEGVVMNITAVGVDGNGFITAHPCVTPRPLASSLNYTAGVNLGNEIIAGLSGSGEICLFSSRGTHLTVDVTGYVPAGSAVTPITPIRFMDTRPGESTFDGIGDDDGKLGGGTDTFLLIQSRGGIPSGINGEDGIAAVIVNVTAVGAEGTGFVTVHPCLDPPPLASSLNYVAGVNRGNELVAPVDAGGRICLFTSATTHLTVDVVGYIPADTDLNPVDPARLLDTRPGQVTVDGESAGDGKVTAGDSSTLQVGGRGNVPDDATAVIVNVTAIGPESVGFVTVHPCLDPAPNASSLNYVPGVNGGNEIIALLSDDGEICLFTSATTHLAVDVVAYLE